MHIKKYNKASSFSYFSANFNLLIFKEKFLIHFIYFIFFKILE